MIFHIKKGTPGAGAQEKVIDFPGYTSLDIFVVAGHVVGDFQLGDIFTGFVDDGVHAGLHRDFFRQRGVAEQQGQVFLRS